MIPETTERFPDLQNPLANYRRWVIEAWAVFAAIQGGLLESLRSPRTLDALIAEDGYEPSALRALVRGLEACGHITIDAQGLCTLSESARRYFLRDSESFVGDSLSFLRTTPKYQEYSKILREGGAVGLSSEQWAYVTRGSATYAGPATQTLLRNYPELERCQPLRLLDVGCGQGTYLLEFARLFPKTLGLGIDPTPAVATAARANVAPLGSKARVMEGSLVDVTEKFDVILINQIFHVVGANEAKEMLRQTRSRLLPGGRVFVQEIVRQAGDAASALFGFNMRLLFENGTVFDADELTRMVENADFVDVRVHPIDGPTSGLVYVTGRVAAEQGG